MRVGVLARYCGGTALAFLATEAAYAAGDCAGLKAEAPPDAEIATVALQPAGPFVIPPEFGPSRTVALPSFCRVQGVLRPTSDSHIAFEVWLPADGWNGSFPRCRERRVSPGAIGHPGSRSGRAERLCGGRN